MPEVEIVAASKLKQSLNPEYGVRFRQGRKAAGVGPLAIATALGVSEQTVLQFETGKQRLDLERFAAACEVVGLNAQWVLFGQGKMLLRKPTVPAKPPLRPAERTPPTETTEPAGSLS
jgi:transcriptional regulator with XRE-family HTH domain